MFKYINGWAFGNHWYKGELCPGSEKDVKEVKECEHVDISYSQERGFFCSDCGLKQ